MKIGIYADGVPERGYGHLFRQFGVWQNISSYYDTFFLCDTDMQREFCEERNLPFTSTGIPLDGSDVMIIDSKADLPAAIQSHRHRIGYTIAVDTLETWARDVECIVFPSFYFDSRIAEYFSKQTKVITGRDYVLLRQSPQSYKSRPILVTFGGSDPNKLTEMVLQELVKKGLGKQVTALIGPGFTKSPQWFAEQFPTVDVLGSQKTTFELVGSATQVISALGVTLQEVEYLGKPCMVIFNYLSDASDFDILREASDHSKTWVNGGFYGNLNLTKFEGALDDLLSLSPVTARSEKWGAGWQELIKKIVFERTRK